MAKSSDVTAILPGRDGRRTRLTLVFPEGMVPRKGEEVVVAGYGPRLEVTAVTWSEGEKGAFFPTIKLRKTGAA